MIFLDGVYVDRGGKLDRFRWVKVPTTDELSQLTHTIAYRISRYLERQGLLVRDAEHSYLSWFVSWNNITLTNFINDISLNLALQAYGRFQLEAKGLCARLKYSITNNQ